MVCLPEVVAVLHYRANESVKRILHGFWLTQSGHKSNRRALMVACASVMNSVFVLVDWCIGTAVYVMFGVRNFGKLRANGFFRSVSV